MSRKPTISKGVDWLVIWIYLAIVTIGLLSIFSVEFRSGDNWVQGLLGFKKEYSKQFYFLLASLVTGGIILLTDSKLFTAMANLSYAFGILLILATFVLGKEVGGSRSWISLGFMNVQPVEVCKVFTSLALAKFLSQPETDFRKTKQQLIAAAIAFAPAVLSVLQKEPGAALVYAAFAFAFYREGLPTIYITILLALLVLILASILIKPNTLFVILTLAAILLVYLLRKRIRRNRLLVFGIAGIWLLSVGVQKFAVPALFNSVLKPHQVVRIFTTFGIEDYSFKSEQRRAEIQREYAKLGSAKRKEGEKIESYNVKQSKIAIGSGGFAGKGFLNAALTQGDLVPAQNTDFIFSTIGESFGFLGCLFVLLLYFGLMLRFVFIAERQRSVFSRVYAYCVAGILFFHVALNVSMTLGLAPSPGITLPLLSYGGSSLLTFSILIFILLKLDADRQMILR